MATAIVLAGQHLSWDGWRTRIASAERQLWHREQQVDEGRAAERYRPQFVEEIERLETEMERFQVLFPSQPRMFDLLEHVRRAAGENGLLIERLTPRGEAAGPGDSSLRQTVHLTVRGPYAGLLAFCEVLQSGVRLLVIDELRFYPLGPGRPPELAQADLVLFAFLEAPAATSE